MKKKIVLITLLIVLCSTSGALGYVIGNTNLGIGGYPDFSSYHAKPSKPYTYGEYSVNQYKTDVEKYICQTHEYLEAANNDIKRIQENKETTINDANNVINEYNNYIKNGY
jgi:hypothetical protein